MKYLWMLIVFLLLVIYMCLLDEMVLVLYCLDFVCFCWVLDIVDCFYRSFSNILSGFLVLIWFLVMLGNLLYFFFDDFFCFVENFILKNLVLDKCNIFRIFIFILELLRLLEMLDFFSNKLYNVMLDECIEKLGYLIFKVLNLLGNLLYILDVIYNFLENKWFLNLIDFIM